ncbi:HD domain-containing protein [Streptomyces neyagawaensis]|uniref:HD domain-containing protein n=1 Tax=Streptomyces neyagawaensis TaxID=42238 RepID=UPI0006E3BAB3|nr:HD domain-containing protein [Streptomyces neyagawaensis]MCL6737467.1 HD domain-containing protein [Streptomyces neyagawaensis]MDE1688248.1 HD domain-containing protein [Streptomyces neyagawaensis]
MIPASAADRPHSVLDILATDGAPGPAQMSGPLADIWVRALPYLDVRGNDEHSLYAFGLASALVDEVPGARQDIVFPAILLHDTGWKTIDLERILAAVAEPSRNRETVRRHETEGAAIAAGILASVGYPAEQRAAIVSIIDGHDTRDHSMSPDDAVVKDADKLWRISPHGLRTIGSWFGLDPQQTLRLVSARLQDHLFTHEARTMASALGAVAAVELSPAWRALDTQ